MSGTKDFVIEDGELSCYLGDAADIVIPEGVERIGDGVFIESKNLRSVKLPNSLTWIGQCAFSLCKNLKSVTIPASVTYIDRCAFSESGLEEVIIEGKPEIKLWAFGGTPWKEKEMKQQGGFVKDGVLLCADPELTQYTIPQEVKIIGCDAFKNSKIKEIVVPEGVTKLDICAFAYSDIEKITLPDSLRTIGAHAFSGCANLTELTIPKSVSQIDDGAFEELNNCVITILNERDDEEVFRISPDAFGFRKPIIKEVRVPYGSVAMRYAMKAGLNVTTFPRGPIKLGNPKKYHYIDDAFCCEGDTLHEYFGHEEIVNVPKWIHTIASDAFADQQVREVYLPDSVKIIEETAFSGCEKLERICGNGVRRIADHAFYGCQKLEKVTFPYLEEYVDLAFVGCDNLQPENMLFPAEALVVKKRRWTCRCMGSKPIEGKIHAGATNIVEEQRN